MNFDILRSEAQGCGVYLMKDAAGVVLYVGKAKNLHRRLASYRSKTRKSGGKTAAMLVRVAAVETILTRTEKESLILESSLIKQHRPRYNIILRDDKSYPLVKVTVNEDWPRLVVTRRRQSDGARYFGPFSSTSAMRNVVTYLHRIFPLRSCKGREVAHLVRPCLDHQTRGCPAPCTHEPDRKKYQEAIALVIRFFEGRHRELIVACEERMRGAAARQDFEEAAVWRDRMAAFRETVEQQVVSLATGLDQDVFALASKEERTVLAVLFVRDGAVTGRQIFRLRSGEMEEGDVMKGVLTSFYDKLRFLPDEILVPLKPADSALFAEWLSERRGKRVALRWNYRGDRRKLLEMAQTNAAQVLAEDLKKGDNWQRIAAALKEALSLPCVPERVECLDISTSGGAQAVASLVSFVGGEAEKSHWRHYRIRTVAGQDDYRMMAEAAGRRLAREPLPDLLVVDGGRGHLQVVVRAAVAAGVSGRVALAAIAKGEGDAPDRVFRPGRKNPVGLPSRSAAFFFLMRLRDEAHRFGITFHRRLRRKENLVSSLDSIPGIGPARRRTLLATLGSESRVRGAGLEELAAVSGVGLELARTIFNHYHGDSV